MSAQPRKIIVCTDVGHDCDDFVFLLLALALHKADVLDILCIATVSQNNLVRAQFAAWQCDMQGVAGIPIVAVERELAVSKRNGKALNGCLPIWDWCLAEGGDKYVLKEDSAPLQVPTLRPEHSIAQIIQERCDESSRVTLFMIGPGLMPEPFSGCEDKIEAIFFQGIKDDEASFNFGSDWEAYQAMEHWSKGLGVPRYFLGKNTAYETQLRQQQLVQIAEANNDFPFLMALQLGISPFRDADREMFYRLYPLPEGQEGLAATPSEELAWFKAMSRSSAMYDLTCLVAFLFLGRNNMPYAVTTDGDMDFSIGATEHDVQPPLECYLEGLTELLQLAVKGAGHEEFQDALASIFLFKQQAT